MEDNYKHINNIVRHWFKPDLPLGTVSDRISKIFENDTIQEIVNTNPQWRECVLSQIGIYSSLYDTRADKYKIVIEEEAE